MARGYKRSLYEVSIMAFLMHFLLCFLDVLYITVMIVCLIIVWKRKVNLPRIEALETLNLTTSFCLEGCSLLFCSFYLKTFLSCYILAPLYHRNGNLTHTVLRENHIPMCHVYKFLYGMPSIPKSQTGMVFNWSWSLFSWYMIIMSNYKWYTLH